MMRTCKVHKTAKTIRLTRDLVGEGFEGELQGFSGTFTLVLCKPGTSFDQTIRSLETTIRDLRLRKEIGKTGQ